MRFRSKPSEIEAVQWTGDNIEELVTELGAENVSTTIFGDGRLHLWCGKDGAQDWVPVPVGHWLVHQPDDLSDIWPVDPDYFAGKYEAVGDRIG